jgi:hypothetical protein
MEKHILSKSTFIKGYHCLKSLYLHKKRPFLRDKLTAEQLAKFKRGHHVGDLAQQLFPGGIDVSPKSPSQYQKSVIRTTELIAQGQEVIYEATFQFEQVLVMLDMLVKTRDGYDAYEVKSSKKLSETYYTDAALQNYVIVNSGLEINHFFLVYVDEHYRMDDKIDLQKFFILKDVSDDVESRWGFIADKIAEEKEMLLEKHSPKIEVGDQCFSPYKCDFVGFCWKKIPNKPYMPLPVQLKGLMEKKSETTKPLSFIFSEQVVPQCKGEKVYTQNCFAFKIGAADAVISGKSCEAKQVFIDAFFEQIEKNTTYFTFDKGKLKAFLEEITMRYPAYSSLVNSILSNTIGLLDMLVESKQISLSQKTTYKLSWLSKNILGKSQLSKNAISSDIVTNALYQKMETTGLWADSSPDIDTLKDYLSLQREALSGLWGEI